MTAGPLPFLRQRSSSLLVRVKISASQSATSRGPLTRALLSPQSQVVLDRARPHCSATTAVTWLGRKRAGVDRRAGRTTTCGATTRHQRHSCATGSPTRCSSSWELSRRDAEHTDKYAARHSGAYGSHVVARDTNDHNPPPTLAMDSSFSSSRLSASQLDHSQRSNGTAANSVSASRASDMASSQRLLKVMQSRPIQRPDTHLPHPHIATQSVFASSSAARGPRGRSASPTPSSSALGASHSTRSSESQFDVLSSFKRELERVRRDVAELASSERIIEARQQARLNELYATAPSYLGSSASASASASAAAAAAAAQHRQQLLRQESTAHAASAFNNPPSSSFISTITTLLHSPKLGARPRSASPSRQQQQQASSDFPRRPNPFALAPVHAPSPFPAAASVAAHHASASSSSLSSPRDRRSSPELAAAASSGDPHMQSLWSKGSTLLSSQSSALDASRTKLESLLSQLHHWKATQSTHLSQRISSIESEAAQKQRHLVERFEADRAKLEQQAKISVEEAIRAHRRVVETHVTELNAAVEREFKRTGGIISGDFEAIAPNGSSSSSYYGPSAAMSTTAAPSMSIGSMDRSMRLEHLDAAGGTRKDGKVSSDDDESASVRATEKRKRLQYQPAVSGLGPGALSRSQPLSARKSKPARATASSVLYSSDSEEDEETRTRRQLVEQAQFLHSQRARKREAILSASLGVSGRSQGRSQAQRQQEQEALRKSAADARRVLESSSDEEAPQRKAESDPTRRPARAASSVSFADHAGSSGPNRAPSRSPTIATPSSTSRRKRRTDKDRAAAVYNASSEDEDLEIPPPPIEAALARASNGRVQGTPSKHAPSLAQLSDTFQKRIQTIKQPVVPGRPMNSAKREEQKSATVEDE